ncbi:hypothetical protein HN020_11340 [Brevibacillus borstelensis]|jgi:hypothetical protein|uniref:hypothetical protein n=1 Tax=Brevibacillus borstelensis TaxID=45462 RepID=UPI00148F7B8A|nr:hypothetical protein [Brevibacillus borstelensis]MCM3625621.1 hypothetical protein [Brevibacillus borstelensis]NOU55342.1 hypothetical protein [Brevibacillus borstelensis]
MNDSWQISMDIPETLNFAIFVGYALGILPEKVLKDNDKAWPEKKFTIKDSYQLEEIRVSWGKWWTLLLQARQDRSTPRLKRPHTEGITSDKFKQLCEEIWPDFYKWWNMPAGGHIAMMSYTTMGRKEIRTLIREFEEQVKRPVQPFSLKIDLVYAGLEDVVEVSSNYAVMSINPPPYYNTGWWSKKISEIG